LFVIKTPGATNVPVLALAISGSPDGDTLVQFAINNLGTAGSGDISAVKLWQDGDGNKVWNSADTLVSVLSLSGATWYQATLPAAADTATLDTDGRVFLVTIDIAGGATMLRTFQAAVEWLSCAGYWADSGPSVPVIGSCTVTINSVIDSYSLSGTIPVEAMTDDSGSWVYLYNQIGEIVDSVYVSSSSGTFTFTAVLPGTYYLYAVNPGMLNGRYDNIIVSGGDTSVGQLAELPAGDVVPDNRINILDAAYLRRHRGSADPLADLNNDGVVNEADMQYLRQNFGRRGPAAP